MTIDKDDANKENTTDSQTEAHDPWTNEESTAEKDVVAEKPTAAEKQDKNNNQIDWQNDLVNRLAFASLNEQRRSRRWNIFFKSLLFIYLFSLLFMFSPSETGDLSLGPHTAVVELKGAIGDDDFASADNIVAGLRAAFKNKNTKGVVLRINSPGGSPVQAGYIYDEIVRLREKYPDILLYAVVTDLAASAAYYIASAADEIYADKASMVGSIGVITGGYGFVDSMKKLGVERRLMTAGKNKAFLDPFSPLKKEHKEHMQGLLDDVHEQFINAVKKGRGDRIKDDPKIYSGLIWTGEQSVKLGLVDGLASTSQVARDIIGQEKLVDYTIRPNYLDRFAEKIGVTMTRMFFSMGQGLQLQ
jgi:protease-4